MYREHNEQCVRHRRLPPAYTQSVRPENRRVVAAQVTHLVSERWAAHSDE